MRSDRPPVAPEKPTVTTTQHGPVLKDPLSWRPSPLLERPVAAGLDFDSLNKDAP